MADSMKTIIVRLAPPERAMVEEQFGLLWSLFQLGGVVAINSQEKRDIGAVRAEGKILDQLEAVSYEDGGQVTAVGTPMRQIKDGVAAVDLTLEPSQATLLLKRLGQAMERVHPSLSSKASRLYDEIETQVQTQTGRGAAEIKH